MPACRAIGRARRLPDAQPCGVYAHDLALFAGLVALGVVVALRTPVQAACGFFAIALGRRFARGDRVEIGGVRGEVLHVGLFTTTLREAPPPDDGRDAGRPGGRVVSISNSALFAGPVFRDAAQFDYVWGEIALPLKYDVDLRAAERVCLDAARVATDEVVREAAAQLAKRSDLAFRADDLEPRVYLRLTDNWIEMSIRFLSRPLAVREVKDRISRRLFSAFQEEGIAIATTSMEVVGMAPVRLEGASFDEIDPSPQEMQ
jgi:small-conductance mechanosensitive channel